MLEIVSAMNFRDEIQTLYTQGLRAGTPTEWETLNPFYTIETGFWTVVTGIPSHGKSTWLDCLMLHLMKYKWNFIIYSPENQPSGLHVAQLAEKLANKPFREGYANRLTEADVAKAIAWLDPRLRILRMAADAPVVPDINGILYACQEIIAAEWGNSQKVGIIIDPWNEMDHTPMAGLNETQMTNHELMFFRHWIRTHNTHGWIVAHPQKPQRDKDGRIKNVGLYDINGSAAYYNKCDHGIIVRRLEDGRTEIEVEKCRFRHLGQKGSVILRYNSGTQTFQDEIDISPGRSFE